MTMKAALAYPEGSTSRKDLIRRYQDELYTILTLNRKRADGLSLEPDEHDQLLDVQMKLAHPLEDIGQVSLDEVLAAMKED